MDPSSFAPLILEPFDFDTQFPPLIFRPPGSKNKRGPKLNFKKIQDPILTQNPASENGVEDWAPSSFVYTQ